VRRRWSWTCSRGISLPGWESYIVATKPAFVLESTQVTGSIDATMSFIARHSTLPAQSAPLPLMDRGYVHSIARQSNGSYLVQLDRVVGDPPVMTHPATDRYLVRHMVFVKHRVHIAELIDVRTNGYTVTAIGAPYTI
jgi:hypothetical protein